MALPFSHQEKACSPRAEGQTLASIHQLHPPTSEGVSLVQETALADTYLLPTYDTVVDEDYRVHIDTIRHEAIGTTWIEELQMTDGTRYQVSTNEPHRAVTDVAVAKTTAWGTQVQGFAEDLTRRLMEQGLASVVVGPEIGSQIPLSHSAHNIHQILDVITRRGYLNPEQIMIEGYSRGAEIGFGIVAYAPEHGRDVLYFNATDPCMGAKFDWSPSGLWELAPDAPHELVTAAYQMGRLLLNPMKAFHYRKTVDLSPRGFLQFVRTGHGVFSGEAGDLARHMPKDINGCVAFLLNSCARDEAEYRDALQDHFNMYFPESRRRLGGHLAAMDAQVLNHISRKFGRVASQLRDGVPPKEIDFKLVHAR